MKKYTIIINSMLIIFFISFCVSAQKYSKLSDLPEYIKKSKSFQRIEWFYNQRAYPYDTIPNIYANRVAAEEIQKIMKKRKQGGNFTPWVSKGPFFVDYTELQSCWDTVSGRVTAMAVHPTDPLTVYIGAASGGLWKTTDGGETWVDIGHDLTSLTFGAIAIDPGNPETVYAGSGEAKAGLWYNFFAGMGLYKSTDGGATWDTIHDFGECEYTVFSDIAISPFNSSVVIASLSHGPLSQGSNLPNEGIWKSTDGGNSWDRTLDLVSAWDITFHPADPDKVYACIGGLQDSAGIYISADQGSTWDKSNSGLPNSELIGRLHLDISQSDPDILYSSICLWMSNGIVTQAYKSTNGGLSWVHISPGVNLGGYLSGFGWFDQGWYDLCIAVDPLNSDHVFIGNVELHETMDGQNFSPVRYPGGNSLSQSIAHCDYHQLQFAPSDPGYFYMGNDGGVYLSTDGCSTSKSKNVGLKTIQFYRVASHPTDPGIMIAGSQDNGTMRTTDGGNSWEVVLLWDGTECFFDRNHPDTVYASQQYGRLYRSFNGGASFSYLWNLNGAWVTPFFSHPYGTDTLYAANDDIYKSPNNGSYFPWITTGLSPVIINTLAQSRANPDHMILAGSCYENGILGTEFPVMVSTNGGYNWTDVTTNIPGDTMWIPRVVTHPWDENTMFIVRCGFSEGNKIYRTTDMGQSWENISGNLPDIPCNDLFINPGCSNLYYVGTDLGVYLSEDAGITWDFAGEGMPLVPVFDFDFVEIENTAYLRAATYGRGIYETDIPVGTDRGISLPSFRLTIAPNPVVDFLKISPAQGLEIDEIIMYNQLGQVVQQEKLPGKTIDVSSLPSGLYLLEVVCGGRRFIGKFVK